MDGERCFCGSQMRAGAPISCPRQALGSVCTPANACSVEGQLVWSSCTQRGRGACQRLWQPQGWWRSTLRLSCCLALVQKSLQISMSWILRCLRSFLYLSNLFEASLGMSVLYRGLQCKYSPVLVHLALFSPLAFRISCALLPLNPTVLTVSHFPSITLKMTVKTGEKSLLRWSVILKVFLLIVLLMADLEGKKTQTKHIC